MKIEKNILLIALLAFLIRAQFIFLDTSVLAEKFLQDDSFYYFSEAKSLASGNGITSNGIDPTNGFQPLWLFLIAPAFLLSELNISVKLVVLIASLLEFANVILIYSLSKIYLRKLQLLPAFLYAINLFVVAQTLSGLDVVLEITFILLALNIYLKTNSSESRGWIMLGLVGGLAALSRLDSILFLAALAIDAALRPRYGKLFAAKILFVAALLLLPWFIWSFINFGTIQQSTSIAVYDHYHGIYNKEPFSNQEIVGIVSSNFVKSFGAIAHHFGFTSDANILFKAFAAAFVVFTALFAAKNYRKFGLFAAYGALLILFYSAYLWAVHIRYFTPLVPLVLISATAMFLSTRLWQKPLVTFATVIILCLSIILNGLSQIDVGYFPWAEPAWKNLDWVKENIPEGSAIGSFNSGLLSYYSGRKTINLDGLLNFEAIKAGRDKKMYAYMKSRGIDYWIDGSFVNKSAFEKHSKGDGVNVLGESIYMNVMGGGANFTLIKEDWSLVKHVSGREMGFVMFVAKVN